MLEKTQKLELGGGPNLMTPMLKLVGFYVR